MDSSAAIPAVEGDHAQFTIGFDRRDRERVLAIWDSILEGQQWSEGEWTRRFEDAWSAWNGLGAVAVGSWAGGALAALDYAGVRGETVLCPSNTFMATPLAAVRAGADVRFVDCDGEALCVSCEDFEGEAEQHKPKAAILVHIRGHIA